MMSVCPNCGINLDDGAKFCASCGYEISPGSNNQERNQEFDTADNVVEPEVVRTPVVQSSDRIIAGILALLFGGLGIHKFYLNDTNMGLVYLCFCWTGIPEIIGFIEGIIYLTSTDEEFQERFVKQI